MGAESHAFGQRSPGPTRPRSCSLPLVSCCVPHDSCRPDFGWWSKAWPFVSMQQMAGRNGGLGVKEFWLHLCTAPGVMTHYRLLASRCYMGSSLPHDLLLNTGREHMC